MSSLPKGALRLNKLSEAIVRVGGIGTALFGQYVLQASKQIAGRTFAQMVDVSAVTRHPVIARTTRVWLTRAHWLRQRYPREVAGERFVRGSLSGAYAPYPAHDHDRTVDRFVFAMQEASGGRYLTQHEVDKLKDLWVGRRPDAVLKLTWMRNGVREDVVVAVENEASDKSGVRGGWMGLGATIIGVRQGDAYRTTLGKIGVMLIVANKSRARSISKKVLQAYDALEPEEQPEPKKVFWFWSEVRDDGSFSPVLKWRLGQKDPEPSAYWIPWNPEIMPRNF